MTLRAFDFWLFPFEAVYMLKDAWLAKSVTTLDQGMCKPKQTLTQLTFEHIADFLLFDVILNANTGTIILDKMCYF